MAPPLTYLGIFHTIIGIFALICGALDYKKRYKIDLDSLSGKLYIYSTVVTCLTSFGLFSRTGSLNPGHGLSVLILVLILIGTQIKKIKFKYSLHIELAAISSSYFLSFIPTIAETMSRLPVENPIATGPDDIKVLSVTAVTFIVFLFGLRLQYTKLIRKT